MATMLASVDSREVCKCDECGLTQFIPASGLSSPCRRCHVPLDLLPEPQSPETAPALVERPRCVSASSQLAGTIRAFRTRAGLSQRELAGRMAVPRTYVSKIENEKATPTLSSLERLARALEVTVPELLSCTERSRQDEMRGLMSDPFLAELRPLIGKLSEVQRRMVLASVHKVAIGQQRIA